MGQPADTSSKAELRPDKPRLLDQVREVLRRLHYSYRTEKTYRYWIRYFILWSGKRHPRDLGAAEVTAFLNYLANERQVAAATQNQALSALLFLYARVLNVKLPWLENLDRAKRPVRLPVVLTETEVSRLLSQMEGMTGLMAGLLYGCGLRLRECLRLRVKDIDFAYRQLMVREGKGAKDRVTMLPEKLLEPLQRHLGRVKALHERDLKAGYGEVELPDALERKYPRAARQWGWQFVFPSKNRAPDPRSGVIRRHHLYPQTLSRAVMRAARTAGISKHAGCHSLRHYADIGIGATRSPRTCCSTEATSARCRSCSAMRTSRRR